MKNVNLIALAIATSLLSCTAEKKSAPSYELISSTSGISIEKFDQSSKDENKYNYNNEVFKVGSKFTYDFEHFNPANELQYFRVNEDQKTWDFVDGNTQDDSVVKNVIIGTLNGNPMQQFDPNYYQTAVSYRFKENTPYSMSGIIENEDNIWMHPPRDQYFKILELNPFPYVKAPYKIGTKWNWNLTIGGQWGDERWKTWEGNIENTYDYEITDKKTISTAFGDLECLVIESKANSSLGETGLTAYFHEKYGFIKLDYQNIDGSKTLLTLTKHQEGKNLL